MSLLSLALDAPLDPSNDEARRWAEEELRRSDYHPNPSLTERFIEFVDRLLGATAGGGAGNVVVAVLVLLLLAGLVVLLVVVLRREVGATGARGPAGVLDVPEVPAAVLRRRAREALAAGDWDTAVLDGLRTVARTAVERVVLDDAPGRTAHEVAVALTTPFPAEAGALGAAADAFDAVRYGHRGADETTARAVLDLEERLAAARPLRAPLAEVPTGSPS